MQERGLVRHVLGVAVVTSLFYFTQPIIAPDYANAGRFKNKVESVKKSVKKRGRKIEEYIRNNRGELGTKVLKKISPEGGLAIEGFKRYGEKFKDYKKRRKRQGRKGGVGIGSGVVRDKNWD